MRIEDALTTAELVAFNSGFHDGKQNAPARHYFHESEGPTIPEHYNDGYRLGKSSAEALFGIDLSEYDSNE